MVATLEAARKPVGLEIGQAFKVAHVCILDRNTFFSLRNNISYITRSIGVTIQAIHLRGRLDTFHGPECRNVQTKVTQHVTFPPNTYHHRHQSTHRQNSRHLRGCRCRRRRLDSRRTHPIDSHEEGSLKESEW